MNDLNAKWLELVKAGKAEWMPGMSTDGMTVVDADETGISIVRKETVQDHWAPKDALPDWSDPATLGCLLALVRAAWGDDDIYFGSSLSFKGKRWSWVMGGGDCIGQGDIEAEALLAALEEAP